MERIAVIEKVLFNEIVNRPQIDGKENMKITHDEIAHAYTVSMLCRLLAKKRKLNEELCAIIGYLHDIGRIKFNVITKDHATKGSLEARKMLINLGIFTTDEIEIIANAIDKHDEKGNIDNEYDELIKDADALDRAFNKTNSPKRQEREKRMNHVLQELGIN